MCSTSKPKVAETPASPEPVKVAEEEQTAARDTARKAAVRRYGVRSTDVTHGGAVLESQNMKRQTLGA